MSRQLIRRFWEAMGTNDFAHASTLLAPDFELFMPQSGEHLTSAADYAAFNTAYPATGLWRFDIRSLVGEGAEVVSDVAVTDGTLSARAITFHTVEAGLIRRQVEYWPDPYPAPKWRRQWFRQRSDFPF